ncbi:PREDICTED: cyclin-A1-4-like isoform X3 [Lupinus angustifolius]|uniref:cyclin-A1-4-like isoform X3 n=1 Tax=Lupinus angustifolius TaxID=3871 RepID=UPI00092E2783|nr:PREDICTED: cyclin-A1-4-like isoform X3 [Lupinus angustifolius]
MFTRTRNFSSSSPSSSSSEKKKVTAAKKSQTTKKRPALTDVTNKRNASLCGARNFVAPSSIPLVPCTSKAAKTKKDSIGSSQKDSIVSSRRKDSITSSQRKDSIASSQRKDSIASSQKNNSIASSQKKDSIATSQKKVMSGDTLPASLSTKSSGFVLSERTCSTKSSQLKAVVQPFLANMACASRRKSLSPRRVYSGDTVVKTEETNEVVDIDNNIKDPQFCASIAHEIYEHLRAREEIRRPSMDFMEKTQKDIDASMRAVLIDWLVEVSEEYRLVPDTLFLTVNYVDRYLSSHSINRKQLQLLGVACMRIAAKYEEICAPEVQEFCDITDNTYSKEQVLQMEFAVLNSLKFEMTAPTVNCFLRRFIIVAQRTCEVPALHLEYLAAYLAELSLLEYAMLKYTPSLVAASATFLATYILLLPRKKPWNSTLRYYTGYQAPELQECVMVLHWVCCNGYHALPAIREKYSQHKFKFVAKKYCPLSIPPEVFQN